MMMEKTVGMGKEIIALGPVGFLVGVAIGIMCSLAVFKLKNKTEGKTVIFTPWPRIQSTK